MYAYTSIWLIPGAGAAWASKKMRSESALEFAIQGRRETKNQSEHRSSTSWR